MNIINKRYITNCCGTTERMLGLEITTGSSCVSIRLAKRIRRYATNVEQNACIPNTLEEMSMRSPVTKATESRNNLFILVGSIRMNRTNRNGVNMPAIVMLLSTTICNNKIAKNLIIFKTTIFTVNSIVMYGSPKYPALHGKDCSLYKRD